MTREDALATARALQMHPFLGQSLTERIADALLAAYEAGYEVGYKDRADVTAQRQEMKREREVLASCGRCGAQVSEAARETHECAR